jgi:hypothetical protein
MVITALLTHGVIVLFLVYSIEDSYTILYLFFGDISTVILIEIVIRSITHRKVNKGSEGFFPYYFK